MAMNGYDSYEPEEMKEYIAGRMESRKEVTGKLVLFDAVSRAVDASEAFVDMMISEEKNYGSDDEKAYIEEETGLDPEFIDEFLWFKMCYEMELDMYLEVGKCPVCDSNSLFHKEDPEQEYGIKVVCKSCGNEFAKELEEMEEEYLELQED